MAVPLHSHRRTGFLLPWVALLAAIPLAAERYSFRHYGEREGLLNPMIRMVDQDKDGLLWVLTVHGVYRFDGMRLEYMHGKGIPQTDIRWLHCAQDGSTWFRTRDGLLRWRDGKTMRVPVAESPEAGAAQAAGSDREGNIWLLTGTRRLERLSASGRRRETMREEPAGLWSVLALAHGAVLTGCGDGLCEWRAGEWARVPAPAERYVRLYQARDHTLYARGRKRIARRRPGETGFTDITHGLPALSPDQPLPALAVDFHRRPLTSTAEGIARLEGDRWEVIGDRQGFPDQVVRSVLVDREGGIWIGTLNGLYRWLGDGAWRQFGSAEGLPRRGVETAAQDKQGGVWVTSGEAGVFHGVKGREGWRFHREEKVPPSTAVLPMEREDALWVGLASGGVWRYWPGSGQRERVAGVDPAARVNEFSIDSKGRALVLTNRGFYREKTAGQLALVVPGREFHAVSEDRAGVLWLGGADCIARIEGDRVSFIPSDDGVEKRSVRAIYAAPDDVIWTGTWTLDGVRTYRLKNGRLETVPFSDGVLEKSSTFFIRPDGTNKIWAGTVRGAAYRETGRWHHYNQTAGLPADQCTYACFLRDGSIWFATTGGLAQYTPPVDRGPLEPPAVFVRSAAARFGPLPLNGPVEVSPYESDLEVDYAVLSTNLEAPPNVRYRLREGDGWRPARQRPLTLPDLPPGAYRLELAAQGRNGVWTAKPVAYAFRVAPFWWQTWWFRAAVAGWGLGLAALVWRQRLIAARKRQAARLREMVDQYPGVVFLLNPDGRFALANRRLEESTFQPRGGLVGRLPAEVMSKKNAANFERNLQRILAEDRLLEYREEYEVPTGRVVFDIRAFPLRDPRGRIETVCCFATDVTDRWRLEQEKARAVERYESLVRQSTEAIWRIEYEPPVPVELPVREFADACYTRGFVREANAAAAAILGVTLEELIGRRYDEMVNRRLPENRDTDRRWYQAGFRLEDFVTVFTNARGEQRTLMANTVGIVENGCLARSWTTQRDVTEQRRLEMERAQAVERYESFVSNSSEGIWRIEFEPPIRADWPQAKLAAAVYARGRIREANVAAAAFFGLPLELFLGKRYGELVEARLPENVASARRWYENGFQAKDTVTVIKNPAGEQRVLLSNSTGVVVNGYLVRAWVTQRDITERWRLEELITNTARGVSAEIGARFFSSLVEQLAGSLGASQALACELLPGAERARVLAVWAGADLEAGMELELAGTPAAAVVASGVAQTYGLAQAIESAVPAELAGWSGGSAMVMPLVAADGSVTGFLVVNWATSSELSERARAVIEIFASRAAAELDRLRIERDVLAYQQQLKELAARNQQVAEHERARLAREIHDELGQHLTAIKIGLSRVRRRIHQGATGDALLGIGELSGLADETVQSVRRVATALRPPVLDQLGLAAAIRWQAKEMQQRLGIPIVCRLEEVTVEPDLATAAFRVLQESLTNVMRHSQATRVEIEMQRRNDWLCLTIVDNGAGFSFRSGGKSLGLLGMQERAAAVDGRVTVASEPGRGTRVEAMLPIPMTEGERAQ